MTKLIFENETYQLRGALFQVYRELKGSGISEAAWEKALGVVLDEKKIPHKEQTPFSIHYKGVEVGRYYTDVIAWDNILLELKVLPDGLSPINFAQTLSYLKVTGFPLALLVNFGAADIEIERIPNFIGERTQQESVETNSVPENDLTNPDLTYAIRAALFAVHRELGPGFIHYVYRRATMIELRESGIPFEFKEQIPVTFHNQILENIASRLIVVDGCVAVAPVAFKEITSAHRQKLARYLRWLDLDIGLLANFYKPSLEIETIKR